MPKDHQTKVFHQPDRKFLQHHPGSGSPLSPAIQQFCQQEVIYHSSLLTGLLGLPRQIGRRIEKHKKANQWEKRKCLWKLKRWKISMFPNSMFGTRYNHFEFLPCAGIFNILNSLKTRMWDQCDSISVKRQAEIYRTKQVWEEPKIVPKYQDLLHLTSHAPPSFLCC